MPTESLDRLLAWLASEPRQPPAFAFTAGPLRELADWVEVVVGRAVREERERCAKIAESTSTRAGGQPLTVPGWQAKIAAAIRDELTAETIDRAREAFESGRFGVPQDVD